MTLRFAPLFLPLLAAAQSTEEPEPPAIRLNTETAFRGFVFFAEDEQGMYGGRSELVFAPDLELELPSNARFETALQARADAVDSSRNRIYLYEGFLDLSFESWDIRTGRQIVRTGRVDGMRPTDYFRRRDFTDFLEADEEPIDAVRVDRYEKDWVFTGVWAPYFQPDILPLDPRNPWTAPLLPPTPGGTTPSYVVNDSSSPAGLDSSEVGLWAGRSNGGVDWSASYFYGHDRIPSSYMARPLPPEASGETLTVELFPGYQRLHVLGLDGETTWGDFVFRGETTYTRPGDPSGSHTLDQAPYAMLALGADRTLSRIVGSHDVYLNLQYLFDSAQAPVGEPTAAEFGNPLRHFYRHAMTNLLEYRFDPYRKLVTKAFFNLIEHDYAVQSEFNWKPSDGWTWSVGVDLAGGPQESFFGTYAANDRLRTALTFDWQAWQFRRSPPAEAQPPPGMELQTTAWVGGEWVAVISGQRVRSGDVVEGATVVDIADGIVAMELVGRSFTLRF
jgi:hypothetical protein